MTNIRRTMMASGKASVHQPNLQWHLDAGDSASYSGSGQIWYDLTSNDFDFYRGRGAGASSDDPTFNGSAGGKSGNEYFSFDGGDLFELINAHSGEFIREVGREDVPFTLEYWIYFGSRDGTIQSLFSNGYAGNAPGFGFYYDYTTDERLIASAMGLDSLVGESSTDIEIGGWHQCVIAAQLNDSTSTFYLDGAADGTWTADQEGYWESGDSNQKAFISGRSGDGYLLIHNLGRVAIIRGYDAKLTAAQVLNNFNVNKGRFSL
jgi:hypothetical protein